MFIVLMLIVMVSAAGVFVAKSSSLEIRSSGYVRQAGQTHYLAESGVATVINHLRNNCRAYFTDDLRRRALAGGIPSAQCAAVRTAGGYLTPPCYSFNLSDLDGIYSSNPERSLFASASGSGTSRIPGSFGVGSINPGLRVTVTELNADTAPQRGNDLTNPSIIALPIRFEVTAEGQTEMASATFGSDTTNAARGTEAARAITVIQCN